MINKSVHVFTMSFFNTGAFGQSGSQSSGFGAQPTFGSTNFGTSSVTSGSSPLGSTTPAIFGGQSSNPQFGTSSSASSTGFPTGSSPGLFGASPNPPSQTVFGGAAPSSGFGSTFGGATASGASPTAGLFGSTATSNSSPATGLFGGATPTGASLFGGATQTSTTHPFGGPPATSTTSGGFGQGATGGASNVTDPKSQFYTPMDKLTPEELREFQAPQFTLGSIPTRPPPKELCF